jgi:hypothetical protein
MGKGFGEMIFQFTLDFENALLCRGKREKRGKEGKNLYVKFDKLMVFIVYHVRN